MFIGFTKMQGSGNDFIVIDNMNGRIELSKEQIIYACGRHFGIGADGLILIESKPGADCFMNYYNSNGTQAEMCGNGVRCVTQFLIESLKAKKDDFKIDTRGGVKEVKRETDGTFSVDMGKPVFISGDFPSEATEIEGEKLYFVSMGNPHAVAFVKDVENFDLAKTGLKVEKNKNFPNKINFEIVEEVSPKEYKVRVWERGCGETLSCGTGACAVYAVLAKLRGKIEEINIKFPGGGLILKENNGNIIMRGEARSVYSGMIEI